MLSQSLSNERLSIFDIIILTITGLLPANFNPWDRIDQKILEHILGGLITCEVFIWLNIHVHKDSAHCKLHSTYKMCLSPKATWTKCSLKRRIPFTLRGIVLRGGIIFWKFISPGFLLMRKIKRECNYHCSVIFYGFRKQKREMHS